MEPYPSGSMLYLTVTARGESEHECNKTLLNRRMKQSNAEGAVDL